MMVPFLGHGLPDKKTRLKKQPGCHVPVF